MTKRARLTPNDGPKLSFVLEQKAVTIPLLHRALFPHCASETSVNEWLRRMASLGYIVSVSNCITPRGRLAYRATDAVNDLVLPGSAYSTYLGKVSHASLPHTLAVAEVASRWYQQADHTVLSERRLQYERQQTLLPLAPGTSAKPLTPYSVRRDGGYGLHLPDLIVESPSGRIAVEVELQPKDPSYYEDLLRGYFEAIDAGYLQAVHYYLPDTGSNISWSAMRKRIWDGADAALRPFDPARNRNVACPALWKQDAQGSYRAQDLVWVLRHQFLYDSKV